MLFLIQSLTPYRYLSAYDPQSFDATKLKSTLRLSATYNHPKLRAFAIKNLEELTLPPIERFALSRDCNVKSWMPEALRDLCRREEPITAAEGEVLGVKMLTKVAAKREALRFKRGSHATFLTNFSALALSVAETGKNTSPSTVRKPNLSGADLNTTIPTSLAGTGRSGHSRGNILPSSVATGSLSLGSGQTFFGGRTPPPASSPRFEPQALVSDLRPNTTILSRDAARKDHRSEKAQHPSNS